ncbi:piggyBac transposable element-derived protein 4-like [Zerene cesonia]|uniref:piggyBac transposable element-derived protein 4-like n=1 Tax=Zerene cesonia TaxID=33412 RepID=UPI0018E50C78|nr:piggyBac transposable element-derived protein 4-like [Zerene cesonia]
MSANASTPENVLFGDREEEEEMFTDSSSSDETSESDLEDEESPEVSDEGDQWKETGSLKQFPFTNTGQFNVGLAVSPIDFFELIFNSTFMTTLVTSINDHALKLCKNSWKETTVHELRTFFALIFHMGHIRIHRINDYWSTDSLYNLPFCRSFMSRDRFLYLLKNLSFNDGNTYKITDPNRYLKPLINFFNGLMKELVSPPKNLAIDEDVVHCGGRLKIRQHIDGKMHKYGVKMYALTDTNGITQKMHIYCGSHDTEVHGRGHAEKVVMLLMADYFDAGHSVYTNSFYSSVALAEKLLEKRTYLTGILRANRFRNPSMIKRKIGRGTLLTRYNSRGVCVTNYKNNRNVLMISTEHHSNFEQTLKSGNKIQKPNVVIQYNKNIKGVDKKNQMLSYYPSFNKSTRWYKKIILYVTEVMLLNAFIMFKEHAKASGDSKTSMTFLDFRLSIIKNLLNIEGIDSNDLNSGPSSHSRIDSASTVYHLPDELPKNKKGKRKRKDCKHCLEKRNVRKASRYYCPLCYKTPGLCIECFREYHGY